LLAVHQRLVGETLGECDGAVLIDESGVVKQGRDSAGVVAQYCGAVGKVANSQDVARAWATPNPLASRRAGRPVVAGQGLGGCAPG